MEDFQENNNRGKLKARLEQARLLLQKQEIRMAEIKAEIREILDELHKPKDQEDEDFLWDEEDPDWNDDPIWDNDSDWDDEF